jgi:hypothetical protein
MGGYTRVISELVDLSLHALDTNPRAKDRVPLLRATMQVRVPEMRNRVQAVLSRSEFQPSPRADVNAGVASGARLDPSGKRGERLPLAPGSHAEVTLRAESIRWLGRVDLLTIAAGETEIVDYKTGFPDDSHLDQVWLGGFTRSSQHLDRGGCDGQASGMDEGVDGQVADEVAGQAVASTRCRAAVLV